MGGWPALPPLQSPDQLLRPVRLSDEWGTPPPAMQGRMAEYDPETNWRLPPPPPALPHLAFGKGKGGR